MGLRRSGYFVSSDGASAAITGTAAPTITETDIVNGGKTVIITLTGDTFKAAGTGAIGSTADTQALIDGFDAATSPTNGWNNEVRDKALTSEVVRTSSTIATWTVGAQAGYDVSATETITGTIPTDVLVIGAEAITATPTFTVTSVAGSVPVITSTTSPAITGTALTIVGTDFQASQGSGGVTQEQGAVVVALTETAWADTEITATSATIESTGLKYGSQTIRVTDDSASDDTDTFTANPLANNDFITLTSVATEGQLLTISGVLAIGDQVRYEDVLFQGGSPTAFSVTVNANATFSFDGATPDGAYTFEVNAWDISDQTWGTSADQNVQVGDAAEPLPGAGAADIKATALRGLGFNDGMNSMESQWLASLGHSVGTLNDRWKSLLDSEAILDDALNSRKKLYFEAETGLSGLSLNEIQRQFWLIQ